MAEGTRGQALIWIVAAVLGTLAAVRLLDGGHGPEAAPPLRVDGAGAPQAPAAGRAGHTPGGVGGRQAQGAYVHVVGAVRQPGLYRVPASARVAEALERAGGPARRADLTAVNLAAPVQDGQQIVVPARGPATATADAGAAASAGPAAAPTQKLSLSTATAEDLEELDGIGPTLAERIVEHRQSRGGFRSIEDLGEVEGIGEKRLASLREALQP